MVVFITDRTTKVTMVAAVSQYIAGMTAATESTKALGNTAAVTAEKQRAASTKIGAGFLAIGAVAAVGVALAIKEFAEFDAKMAQLQTLSHAGTDDMKSLTQEALQAGQAIGFTANEVADAEIELVKAGISVKDIMGGALPGALQLAAAGQIDVADATEIATIAMTQFGLKGSDIPHVADLLSAGADKALGSVGDLGEALKSGGLVAAQFGVSLDETVGTLSAFANAGLIGETAGTDLRQMLLKLANPAKDAADTMKDLGIEIYGTNGKFVGVADLAGQLQTKLGSLSDEQRNAALATIFGSRAIAGANVLYKEGAKGISEWTKEVNDTGFAQQQAAGKMNNLLGDLKKLEAAFQTDIIESGSGANDTLRLLAQSVTNLISGISNLPQPVLAGALALGAVVAVTALITGGFLTVVPKVAAFKLALQELGLPAKTAGLAIGGVAVAVSALVLILAAVAEENAKASALTAQYGDTLDATTHKITSASREVAKANLAIGDSALFFSQQSAYDGAKKLGVSLGTVTDAALGQVDALRKLKPLLDQNLTDNTATNASAKKAGLSWHDYLDAVEAVRGGVLKNNQSIEDAIRVAKEKAEADKTATATGTAVAGSLDSVSSSASDANTQVSDLATALKDFGKGTLDARAAQRDFRQAVDDAAKALKDNGATLDISTQKGRDNQAALDKIASSANAAAAAIYSQTGNQDDATSALADGKTALDNAATSYGLTGKALDDYVDSVLATPAEVVTSVAVTGIPSATASVDALIAKFNAIPAAIKTTVSFQGTQFLTKTPGSANGNLFAGHVAQSFANGGTGIYSGTSAPLYKFAEPGTNWEAFVSGKPGQEGRNRAIAWDALNRLGGAPTSSAPASVSLAGATILLSVDGKQMTGFVQDQIVDSNTQKSRSIRNGVS